MSVDPASLPLCHKEGDKEKDTSDAIQIVHELSDQSSRRSQVKNNRKTRILKCIILSIVASSIAIAVFGMTMWMIYRTRRKAFDDQEKSVVNQSFPTEISSSRYQLTMNGARTNKLLAPYVLDTFSENHVKMRETTPLLTTIFPYENSSSTYRKVDITIRSTNRPAFTQLTSLVKATEDISFTYLPWTTNISIQQPIKKVLFIVADGIPADVIENVTATNLRHIQDRGAYTKAYVGGDKGTYTQTPTISSPGYMSLLTGTWGNKHNIYDNYVKNPNYRYKNIFRLLKEQQPNKTIGIFSTWTTNRIKLIGEGLFEAGNITFDFKSDGYELDHITYPHDKQSHYIYNIDRRVTNETSECIRVHAPDLSWVYLQYTDDVGHYFGDGEKFVQSIMYLDEQIGQISEAIDYRMKYHNEDWLLIITTDHGRDPKTGKHHAGQSIRERTTWIVTNSQETNTYFRDFQPAIVDILPTIARFMNLTISIDSERELDGTPLIGRVSLIKPTAILDGNQLNISWTVLDNTGNVTIWISTSNLFKKGQTDDYKLIDIVPINMQMIVIDVQEYPSQFYKIVLAGPYNMVNKWVYRQRTIN